MNSRVKRLRAFMAQNELDAFMVTEGKNRRYLSGFMGSSGVLLVTNEAQYLLTDFRYFEQVARQAPSWSLWKQKMSQTQQAAVCDLLEEVKPGRLGIEANVLTVAEWDEYQEKGPKESTWVATKDVIRNLRAIKSADEIERIRHAQRITDAAGAQLPLLIEPGRTEKQVAWELEKLLHDLGADGLAFDIIVASGPNSALPHYRPADRVIEQNEIVLVDFGAKWDGYHSDMTRTFFTGEPTPKYNRVYHIVLDALHKVEQTIKAGFGLKAGDAIARDFIKAHDHGEHFGHGLGHAVGLDIHETPKLSSRAEEEETLAANNIMTIEPGIYLPGWGGIRIEDLALITQNGIEIFTTTTKNIDAWRLARG
ncbi:MAG: M24 family metallopeptidase [Ardenticatenaceae bacterium]